MASLAVLVLGFVGCSRVPDSDAYRFSHSQLGSDARQIAQSCLIYESTDATTDADHVITLEDLRRAQPALFSPELLQTIEKHEIVFVPQLMPIRPTSILVVYRYERWLGVIAGDLSFRFYEEKTK